MRTILAQKDITKGEMLRKPEPLVRFIISDGTGVVIADIIHAIYVDFNTVKYINAPTA